MAENKAGKKSTKKVAMPAAKKVDDEAEVLANIAAMSGSDRAAYAKGGKVVCFFQSAQKFRTRYATFGFQHEANLDEGHMWPVAFALMELTAAEEARISALVKRAAS